MTVFRRLTAVMLLAGIALLMGCSSTSGGKSFNPNNISGTWNGPFTDSAGGSGTGQLIIFVNQAAQSFTILASETGTVFGAATPPTQNLTGVYNTSDNTVQVNQQTQAFGLVAINIDQSGRITGSLTSPNPAVSSVAITGTATNSQFVLHFVSTLTAGGTTTGTITYSKTSTSTTLPVTMT